ncbi:hypothetical protein [Streptomyces sp. NBC_01012]|uniref:hypothetical protein n=1 Tax=Streptomyces sp. NBC_01012 TaxID=2903717 RepID=UPI0038665230|nr:hypothetical protein OG623_06170 [Streptomyces sp. NBC_01012]
MLRGAGRRYGLRGPWVLRGPDLDLPARAAVSGLVSGSLTGTVRMPLLPLAGAAVVAVAVAAFTSRIAALRG